MAYKISGTINQSAFITISNASDGETLFKSYGIISAGSYEFPTLFDDTPVVVTATISGGKSISYGNIIPIETTPAVTNDRAVWQGLSSDKDLIQYMAMSSKGSCSSFGNLPAERVENSATSNGGNQRGVFAGGYDSGFKSQIYYITISSAGSATDSGYTLTQSRSVLRSASNNTNDRGVFVGGTTGSYVNTMDYITISSITNASDFGDLTTTAYNFVFFSNGINNRAVRAGSGGANNVIDYITISSIGNASDFGDLYYNSNSCGGTSNLHGNRGIISIGNLPATYGTDMAYVNIISNGNAAGWGFLDYRRTEGTYQHTSNGPLGRGFARQSTYVDYYNINLDTGKATDWADGQSNFSSNGSCTSNA